MKPDDTHSEIGAVLRSRKPNPQSSPHLETHIHAALRESRAPTRETRWLWWTAPPALAALTFLLLAPGPVVPAPPMVHNPAPESAATSLPTLTLIEPANPLQQESEALGRDAKRATDFLISCLPSLTTR